MESSGKINVWEGHNLKFLVWEETCVAKNKSEYEFDKEFKSIGFGQYQIVASGNQARLV